MTPSTVSKYARVWNKSSKSEKTGKGAERIHEEIMAEEFPNLMKNINLDIKNLKKIQVRSKGITKLSTSRHRGQTI